ncbi:putative N-acetyltransferase san [Wickerhamomyces ciferrii]|uniref:N-acetyltransferase san n=1 Tax=Wickerhamomyces ciferrii (strain ATCC 14091 / BCRC 22168 / CBS 111 / JCM 3599 / NBRC 0793 / NRRL Y-1031 F-60-10) TaxID=1206466 RepID=K0KNI5_WICCF|nr:putative N-acetyltransferase san [Wickerhamomyces ciferrii]CCH42959.1 putative N-acetyltransferase san [Wickerhamomyces ciferrii]
MAQPIALDDLTVNNKEVLRKINEVVLPTRYPDEFYSKALQSGELVKLGDEIPVGAVKAKLIVPQHHSVPTSIYIESIAVLEPYRNFGIGKKFIQHLEEQAKISYIHEITAHIWIKQPEILEWYQKQGFEIKGEVENYYKDQKLDEPTAIAISKKF